MFLLVLVAFFLAANPIAKADPAAKEPCYGDPLDLDPDHIHARLFEQREDMIRSHAIIYDEPCDGQLYLVTQWERFPIAESWRFWAFKSARWDDPADATRVIVEAEYVTGMGPEGAIPFAATRVMERDGLHGWRSASDDLGPEEAREPEEDGDASTEDRPSGELVVDPDEVIKILEPRKWMKENPYNRAHPSSADSPRELKGLERRWQTSFDQIDVDFKHERLVAALFILTSGSKKLKDIVVYKHDDGYDILFTLTEPRIGTADIKRSAIYALLPRDGLPYRFVERGKARAKGSRVDLESGVVNRLADRNWD